jgi:hypothetical protein
MDIDFGLYWNRRYIVLRDIHDVHRQLEAIATELRRWRPAVGAGLLAVNPEDVRTRQADIDQQLEQYRAEQKERDSAREVPDDRPE